MVEVNSGASSAVVKKLIRVKYGNDLGLHDVENVVRELRDRGTRVGETREAGHERDVARNVAPRHDELE